MRRTLTRAVVAGVAALSVASAAVAQQAAQKQVLKATHGAWEIHCLEGTETCAMQQVGKTAEGKRALLVTVQRLSGVTADDKPVPAALTVNTPLGVLIPYGVRAKVDDGDVVPVPLLRCLNDNCAARAPLAEEAVDRLKKGSKATFGFFLQDEVLVDISLNGFTAAYSDLKPVAAQVQN